MLAEGLGLVREEKKAALTRIRDIQPKPKRVLCEKYTTVLLRYTLFVQEKNAQRMK